MVRGAGWRTLLALGPSLELLEEASAELPFPALQPKPQASFWDPLGLSGRSLLPSIPAPFHLGIMPHNPCGNDLVGGSKDNLTEHRERRQGTRQCWFCSYLHDWPTNRSCKSHSTSPGFRFFSLYEANEGLGDLHGYWSSKPPACLFLPLSVYSAQPLTHTANETFCTIIKSTCIKIYNVVYFYWKSLIAS